MGTGLAVIFSLSLAMILGVLIVGGIIVYTLWPWLLIGGIAVYILRYNKAQK